MIQNPVPQANNRSLITYTKNNKKGLMSILKGGKGLILWPIIKKRIKSITIHTGPRNLKNKNFSRSKNSRPQTNIISIIYILSSKKDLI